MDAQGSEGLHCRTVSLEASVATSGGFIITTRHSCCTQIEACIAPNGSKLEK